jgi:hypothetical protein
VQSFERTITVVAAQDQSQEDLIAELSHVIGLLLSGLEPDDAFAELQQIEHGPLPGGAAAGAKVRPIVTWQDLRAAVPLLGSSGSMIDARSADLPL